MTCPTCHKPAAAKRIEEQRQRIAALESQLAEASQELTLLRDYRKYAEREKGGE